MKWKTILLCLLCVMLVGVSVPFVVYATGSIVDGTQAAYDRCYENMSVSAAEKCDAYVAEQDRLKQEAEERKRAEEEARLEEQRKKEEADSEKQNSQKNPEADGPITNVDASVLDSDGNYIIQHGDTLSYISSLVMCPVDYIADFNDIADVNLIHTGNALSFPSRPEGSSVYMIQEGDTLTGISDVLDKDMDKIAEGNRLRDVDLIYGGTPLWISD